MGKRRCVVLPLRENNHGNQNHLGRSQRRLRRPASELLNHFLLFRCVSEFEIMNLLRKSCLSGQLPANQRRACTALPGGRATLGWSSRRTRRRVEGRRWAPRRQSARAAQPAPGLPQGADEAVDRALRVEGHDVPYVEEAGHFIRHAASCSKVDVLPLLGALAALSRKPPPQRRNGAHDCSCEERRGRARPQRPSVEAQPCPAPGNTGQEWSGSPQCAQAGGSQQSSRRRLPVRFPVSFRSFLSNTFAPPPLRPPSSASPLLLCAPPQPSQPPGGS